MFPSKDPILAGLLSLLVPGLGQFYCRQWTRGVMFLAGAFVVALLAPPMGMLLSFGVWIWSVLDAYRIAKAGEDYGQGAQQPIIDIKRLRYPRFNLRPALPYVGIPLLITLGLLVVGTIILTRYGLWNDGFSRSAKNSLIEKIENYKTHTGAYPDSLESLVDPTDPIEKKQILDQWGHPLIYRSTMNDFELLSAGEDGLVGTDDDIPYHP